jgi:DNA/RNA-binding domain of Phe-tRNA-synthetase-like protein
MQPTSVRVETRESRRTYPKKIHGTFSAAAVLRLQQYLYQDAVDTCIKPAAHRMIFIIQFFDNLDDKRLVDLFRMLALSSQCFLDRVDHVGTSEEP